MEKYTVFVDDNYHFMDESERYKLGDFKTCEEAVEACKKIVDEFLNDAYKKGVSAEKLCSTYTMFGEDPFVISNDKACRFSAWDYAEKRCQEFCSR